jgi:flagellar motor protein MotB
MIPSRAAATETKDAVFSSFFDMNSIIAITSSYKQKFGHGMQLLPGLKLVRLLGTGIKNLETPGPEEIQQEVQEQVQEQAQEQVQEQKEQVQEQKEQVQEQKEQVQVAISNRKDIEVSIMVQQAEVDALQQNLKKLSKVLTNFHLEGAIPKLKKEWLFVLNQDDFDRNENIYKKIQTLKDERFQIASNVQEAKNKLSTARQKLYHLQSQLRDSSSKTTAAKITISKDDPKRIYNVENVCLNSGYLNDLENLSFSGTDNGLVTMTETVGFLLERFKSHLQMYQCSCNSKDEGNIYDCCHIKNSQYID